MKYPRVVRVFVEPAAVFAETASEPHGIWALLLLLASEFGLVYSATIISDLLRVVGAPFVALQALWSGYLRYATGPVFTCLVAGLALYLLLRRSPARLVHLAASRAQGQRFDILDGVAVLSYAWAPHTALVFVGVLLHSLGLPCAALPGTPLPDDPAAWLGIARPVVSFGATAALASVAAHQVLRGTAPTRALRPLLRTTMAALCILGGSAVMARSFYLHANWRLVRPVLVGDPVPQFVAHGLDRADVRSESLSGSVVLLDFWATWCGPCVQTMPHLQALHDRLGPRGLRIMAINIEADAPTAVRTFLQRRKLTLPVYSDEGALQERFHVHVYPTSFLLDKEGTVRAVYQGPASPEDLARRIEELL